MTDVPLSTWQQVEKLDLRGRAFHRQETGDEIYGMIYDILLDEHDYFRLLDDAGRKIASGSMSLGSCRIEKDGTIVIGIYMVGSVKIFPHGTHLKPA
jgi:hypothetical protein